MWTPFGSARCRSRLLVTGFLAAVLGSSTAEAQGPDAIKVRLDAANGPYLAGQGVELRAALAARDQRPQLELPALAGARLWIVDTSFQPISVGRIGRSVLSENMFLTRIRLVARSAGTLDVPPVVVRLGGFEGKSNPLRLKIENPPVAGRPADFLGGVGAFTAEAEADARRVRVGQEFLYRIRISGPAAWGMVGRPDPARLRGLPIDARVEPLDDETSDEPPRRAFVYRVRPSRAGDVVLPPVSIASFDPKIQRYITHATNGVPLEVVAAPVFDASKLDYRPPEPGRLGWPSAVAVAVAVGSIVAAAVAAARRLRAGWASTSRIGLGAASRYAREVAAGWDGQAVGPPIETARRATAAMIEYARLSVGRPPGALTPGEARAAIAQATGSDELGRAAEGLAASCDRFLFAENVGEGSSGEGEAASLPRRARDLFTALGRAGGWRRRLAAGRRFSASRDATTD